MPMSKEEKNAAARAKRAAAKATQQPTEPNIDVMADEAIASILSDAPAVSEPVKVEGIFVSESGVTAAETAVQDLVNAHIGADDAEHKAILSMFDLLSIGVASPKEFSRRYADVQAERGNKDTTQATRKSQLKKVLEFSQGSAEFQTKVLALPGCGLQKMYAIRAEMLKLAKPQDTVTDKVPTEPEDDAPSMSPHDLVLHQINNAIDAAANAGYDDVAEQLRAVFYNVKDKEPAEALI